MTIADRITAFNTGRDKKLLQLKYDAMSENAFRFYRGTCHLFYEDLHEAKPLPSSPATWISGDLHLENFGSFKSDNRQVYFDLNDFDEAILAPALFEVARLVTSIFVAFRSLGIDDKKAEKMALLYLSTYMTQLQSGKANYIEHQTATGIVSDFLTAVNKRKQRALLKKKNLVKKKNKPELLRRDDHHFDLDAPLREELFSHVQNWLKQERKIHHPYKIVDGILRQAGTGSLGLNRYVILLKNMGRKGEKYMLIDIKQAIPSSLSPYIHYLQPGWNSEAERVIHIQQRMQNRPPALLSSSSFRNQPYIIQEMQPEKDSINLLLFKDQYEAMHCVVEDMAILTASAQVRSSGRQGSAIADELIAFGNDTQWQDAVLEYAKQYAVKVGNDYNEFVEAYKKGTL